jgi:exopolysaccharide biosynthesis polyprenyl glycosylphosphotransferase
VAFAARAHSRRPVRALIVGTGSTARAAYDTLLRGCEAPLEFVGFVSAEPESLEVRSPLPAPILGNLEALPQLTFGESIDEAVIALESLSRNRLAEIIAALHKLRARIYLYIDLSGIILVYPRADVHPWSLVQVPTSLMETHQWLIKRFLDLVLTSFFFTLSMPVMLLIGVAIKLDSKGPIIFKQWRIGEHGRPFMLYKFRSMVEGAEAQQERINRWTPDGELIHKYPDDPRITRVGRILRRWSLDELPEMWNVLRGDMSLVGPRPELPWIVERYKPDYYRRFLAPPGLTGFWQISERGLKPMHLAVTDDLYYIENYSLWLDLWILLKTPFAVLRGRGAF